MTGDISKKIISFLEEIGYKGFTVPSLGREGSVSNVFSKFVKNVEDVEGIAVVAPGRTQYLDTRIVGYQHKTTIFTISTIENSASKDLPDVYDLKLDQIEKKILANKQYEVSDGCVEFTTLVESEMLYLRNVTPGTEQNPAGGVHLQIEVTYAEPEV